MTDRAVLVDALNFSYEKSTPLFQDFSLQVEKGRRFGLFGPNGAGKTTLMSVITGIAPFESGKVNVLGHDIVSQKKEAKSTFGFVPQDFSFYEALSPMENLEFFGIWSNVNKTDIKTASEELLQTLGLFDVRNKQVKHFSGGMKRRVNLAIGVIHRPNILFLDEPTTGVDVQSRHAIIDFLLQLNDEGSTLFYTSHHLKEAEDLCNEVALIDSGKILNQGKLEEMIAGRTGGLESLYLELTGKEYRD